MARSRAIAAAVKAIPAGSRGLVPQSAGGMGRVNPAIANMMNGGSGGYGPFLPRPPRVFSEGAFSPMPPIQPVPLDEPPYGGMYPDQRLWPYTPGWNLPTPPGSEGLKLASFDQLRTLSQKYSVARACIDLRQQEIRGLEWEIAMTTDAAKAYRGDREAMRDFGERKAQALKFFKAPDPDFWNFDSFLQAMLEEIFVYDALSIVFRPKYGERLGMGGRGLLGSKLDCLQVLAGPTIRPLVDIHGAHPRPPAPAYQQFLYGVPRSDILTIARGIDIDEYGLAGAEVNKWDANMMLYAPYWPTRETPYGFPPVERALLPIISGLQKQEYQLDYFTEGTIPGAYISPGDPNITPQQIRELQDALNAIAGDPAYHQKIVVLPPGSKVEPQRPVDLSDSFDLLVQTQVCMEFDVQPTELGILPNISGGGGPSSGVSASGIRFGAQESRDIKSRKSTKPLLKFICDIFNMVLQDICEQPDMRFQFSGLIDEEDKQAITSLGVEQIQNGVASIDEIRERLDLPPWGLQETSEPIVMTQQGPVPFSMAPQLIQAMLNQGNNSSSSGSGKKKTTSKQPSVKPKRGSSPTKPNGSHPAPVAPGRTDMTPAHAESQAVLQRPQRGKTGGTPSRSAVAGSRKRGEGMAPTQGRLRNKAAESELRALKRHLRKDPKVIYSWQPRHLETIDLAKIADDLQAGLSSDAAIEKRLAVMEAPRDAVRPLAFAASVDNSEPITPVVRKAAEWPGWEHDLGLVGRYKQIISDTFQNAEIKGREIRQKAASGQMFVPNVVLHGLISDATSSLFLDTMTPMWTEAWQLGYEAGKSLATGAEPDFTRKQEHANLQAFLDTEGAHWTEKVSRTGLGNSNARSEIIARTEVARAMNAGTVQAYRDHGITHKQLLTAPDDICDICDTAKSQGIIPLDSVFPGGGLGGPFHPNCRCVPAPAGITAVPPQAHLGKAAKKDTDRLGWLLLRAKDEDGKYRFLLQQRDDGTWGMPGGGLHKGEDPWEGSVRETTEEIGDLPALKPVQTFHHVEDDGKTQVYLYLCDVPYFRPGMNGSTPEETRGAAWFRRKEIGDLDLTPKFAEDWNTGICLKDHVTKGYKANENGETFFPNDHLYPPAGRGARWPYPSRPGAGEVDDHADGNDLDPYPEDETDEFPRARASTQVPRKFPGQGGRRFTDTTTGGPQSPVAQVGSATGVPPSGEKREMISKESANYRRAAGSRKCSNCVMFHPGDDTCDLVKGHILAYDVCDYWEAKPAEKVIPLVGPRPPRTPQPGSPHLELPHPADPADAVVQWDPSRDSDVIHEEE